LTSHGKSAHGDFVPGNIVTVRFFTDSTLSGAVSNVEKRFENPANIKARQSVFFGEMGRSTFDDTIYVLAWRTAESGSADLGQAFGGVGRLRGPRKRAERPGRDGLRLTGERLPRAPSRHRRVRARGKRDRLAGSGFEAPASQTGPQASRSVTGHRAKDERST
jgi:hypothetical protein